MKSCASNTSYCEIIVCIILPTVWKVKTTRPTITFCRPDIQMTDMITVGHKFSGSLMCFQPHWTSVQTFLTNRDSSLPQFSPPLATCIYTSISANWDGTHSRPWGPNRRWAELHPFFVKLLHLFSWEGNHEAEKFNKTASNQVFFPAQRCGPETRILIRNQSRTSSSEVSHDCKNKSPENDSACRTSVLAGKVNSNCCFCSFSRVWEQLYRFKQIFDT